MYLLTYSFHKLGDLHVLNHTALAENPVDWLIRKRREDPSVCIVWTHELSPIEKRRLDGIDLKKLEIEQ